MALAGGVFSAFPRKVRENQFLGTSSEDHPAEAPLGEPAAAGTKLGCQNNAGYPHKDPSAEKQCAHTCKGES
jgi:hypothetical protein